MPLADTQVLFVGRTDIGSRIEQLILTRQSLSLLLYGQRRMGKTSLLNNLGHLLPNMTVPLFVDLQGPVTQASDHTGLLYNISRSMITSAKTSKSRSRSADAGTRSGSFRRSVPGRTCYAR